MNNWQRRMWEELIERQPILPPRGGALLVVGDELPAQMLAGDLIVAYCGWGEVPAKGLAYDRVLLVANKQMPDAELALARAGTMMKADGMVVIVAARGWPWAAAGTLWCNGARYSQWRKWLKAGGWKLEYAATAGFGDYSLLRWLPWAGMVRVMVAKRGGKGGGLRVVEPRAIPRGKVAVAG